MRRSACLLITLLACASLTLCSGCSPPYIPKGAKIPEGFSINCYPQSECTKSDSTPLPGNRTQQIVVLLTSDNVNKVVTWYKTELTLKGFMVLSDRETKGAITLESQNDNTKVTVMCTPVGDKNTVISIAVFPRPK